MPIKPENKNRYPTDWSTRIRPAILERANNCCEVCGIENYSVGWRRDDGSFCLVERCASSDTARRWIEAHQIANPPKLVIIVLTIAHLDHQPENNDPANLKAMCQKCHNMYDQAHRRANAGRSNASRVCLSKPTTTRPARAVTAEDKPLCGVEYIGPGRRKQVLIMNLITTCIYWRIEPWKMNSWSMNSNDSAQRLIISPRK